MYRWLEDKETLEHEFRRTIAGFDKMTNIWRDMAHQNAHKSGYSAYGLQKADMYEHKAEGCREKFKRAGGAWPEPGQSESEFLRSRRPQLEYDFDSE